MLITVCVCVCRCAPIIALLDDILLHCQASATLEAAHALLQTLTSNPRFAGAMLNESAAAALNEVLEGMGFAGLWRSCSFNLASAPLTTEQQDRNCFGLTEKLIEVSFADFFTCCSSSFCCCFRCWVVEGSWGVLVSLSLSPTFLCLWPRLLGGVRMAG
jgi:hypothetical protein